MNTTRSGALARLEGRHVALIVVVAALLAFLPSLADGFVFDDEPLIVRNPFAHDLAYASRCFVTDLWDTPERPSAEGSTRFYRPAVCLSYILNWKVAGGAPWVFHLVNVALHAAACAFAARLALRWTASVPGALLAALVFAIHPSRTENVIWVSGRTDVLMAASLFGAHEVAVSASKQRRAMARWFVASSLFVFALLSKEVAVCWPLLLAVEAAVTDEAAARRRLGRAAMTSFAAVLGYLAVRAAVLPLRPPEIESMALPFLLHVGYVALSLGYYAERVLFPWPQTFHFRPLSVVDGQPLLFAPSVALGAVLLALWVVWLVRAARRGRPLLAVVGAATLAVLPILNVSYTGFPGTTADRFLYLPLFLIALAVGRHAGPALDRWAARTLSPLVSSAMAIALCAVSWVRALDYSSNETVWRHELEVNPDNPQALAGLSQVLAARGEVDDASALLRHALSPAALRYKLLANPSRYYLGLLEMQGSRLADGHVAALEALLDEIASLEGVRAPKDRRLPPLRSGDLVLAPPLWDEHFSIHLANAAQHLSAAGVLVASRLGHDRGSDDVLHRLLARVESGAALDAPAHYNLALALGRSGDYAAARRALDEGAAIDGSIGFRTACTELDETLAKVQRDRLRADALAEPEASVLRAAAYLDLGAYLRAARKLRSAYLARPDDAAIAGVYLDALVHARLDADAAAVAGRMPGANDGKAQLEALRRQLSPRTAHALAPSPGEDWRSED